ncbi:hypothetical protein F4803DRAFT_551508 [Xylaria telfairii]|nr:hypothetical protein F4803DRAFT_551508 [Xylaria telfairii]
MNSKTDGNAFGDGGLTSGVTTRKNALSRLVNNNGFFNVSSQVLYFFNRNAPKPNDILPEDLALPGPKYAPTFQDTPYLRIDPEDLQGLTGYYHQESLFIAVTLIMSLCRLDLELFPADRTSSVDAISFAISLNDQGEEKANEKEARLVKEATFLKRFKYCFPVITTKPIRLAPTVPFRTEKGMIKIVKLDRNPTFRHNFWNFMDKNVAETHIGGKSTRWVDTSVKIYVIPSPVLVKVMEDGLMEKGFLPKLVKEVNDLKKTPDEKWEIVYDENLNVSNYVFLAYDPFKIYRTYVSKDDWDKYMTALGVEGTKSVTPVVRNLPRGPNVLQLDEISKRLEKKNQWLAHLEAYTGDKNIIHSQLYDKLPSKEKFAENNWTATVGQTRQAKVKQMKLADKMTHEEGKKYLEVELSASKIIVAASKRTGQPGQSSVMTGVSANEVARELGWHLGYHGHVPSCKDGKLVGPGWVAEWLHLSAFSFGGFEPTKAILPNPWTTSQVPENLVFGTGETNSLMSRYECIWQEFFRQEADLVEQIAETKAAAPTGSLKIKTNTIPAEYDVFDETETPKFTIRKDYLHMITGDDPAAVQLGKQIKKYPWLALSISYVLKMNESSYLLNTRKWGSNISTQVTLEFFPFRRPMFHRAEAALDTKILVAMRTAVEKKYGLNPSDKKNMGFASAISSVFFTQPAEEKKKDGEKEDQEADDQTDQVSEEKTTMSLEKLIDYIFKDVRFKGVI